MASAISNMLRLARAGFVLASHSVSLVPKMVPEPLALKVLHWATLPIRAIAAPFRWGQPPEKRLSRRPGLARTVLH